MAINFNNIPDSVRTPGIYVEIDNSRALKGLYANPHKALIVGHRNTLAYPAIGTKPGETLVAVTRESYAEGYFGAGSEIARMIEKFKKNNPNTELYAIALSTGTTTPNEWSMDVSRVMAANGNSTNGGGNYYLMINGVLVSTVLTSAWSATDVHSAIKTAVNSIDSLPVVASVSTSTLLFSAKNSGTNGNYVDIRDAKDYYNWISYPSAFSATYNISIHNNSVGAGNLTVSSVWSIIEDEQFHYIIHPFRDTTNLTSLEDELDDRWDPLENVPGIAITAADDTQANLTTLGNSRNSPYSVICGVYDSPTDGAEIAAALGAVAAKNLNNDPARPLHCLELKGVLAPPVANKFTRSERDILLYDGIATLINDPTNSKLLIERMITTYQTNATGARDASYLDATTLATLMEIRYQFETRMKLRFLSPRYKLAGDTVTVFPGSYMVTPSVIKGEIISLFAQLRDAGLIEDLDDFKTNLIVEIDSSDPNRVNCLLAPNLVNQFMILAGKIEFIL